MAGRRQQQRSEEAANARLLIQSRYKLFMRLALAVPIAALFVPGYAVVLIARAFAGQETSVRVIIQASIVAGLTVTASSGLIALWNTARRRGREAQILRERCNKLEGQRDELRKTLRELTQETPR